MSGISKIKKQLTKEYSYRTELHAHTTPASPCSEIEPEEMVEIYHNKGYNAIVITNHFDLNLMKGLSKEEAIDRYMLDYDRTKKAAEKYGMTVLLGAEIRFTENNNDYLLYGADREILRLCFEYLSEGVEKFREVELKDSVFLQAHPFRDGMVLVRPELVDGYETFNMHPGHNSRIGLATRYANESKVKTAGSDFHHKNRSHEAVSALRTKVIPKTSFELAEILKSGEYIFEIGEGSIVLP